MSLKERKGYFMISSDVLLGKNTQEIIGTLMSKMRIAKAEHDYINDRFTYWAYSELFDKIELGDRTPEYHIEVNEKGNMNVRRIDTKT